MLYRPGLEPIERKKKLSTDEMNKESHTFLACKPITSWAIYIVPLELMEKAKSMNTVLVVNIIRLAVSPVMKI